MHISLAMADSTAALLPMLASAGPALSAESLEVEGITIPDSAVQAVQAPAPGAAVAQKRPLRVVPRLTPDPAALARGKAAAQARASAAEAAPTGPGPAATTIVINKPGTASNGTVTPPDSTGAIGPNNYVEMVNAQVT